MRLMNRTLSIVRWLTVVAGLCVGSASGGSIPREHEPYFDANISSVSDACGLEIAWREPNAAHVHLVARTDGTAMLEANGIAWRIEAGKPLSLLIGDWPRRQALHLPADATGNSLTASFDDRALDALALSGQISVEQEGREVAKLPLDYIALWVARLRACVASLKSLQQDAREPAMPAEPRIAVAGVHSAIPRGNPGSWLTDDDYPPRAHREGRVGTTRVSAAINDTGRLFNCVVRQSSGSPDLDDAVCRNVLRRARFKPATDEAGRPISDPTGLAMLVHWTMPDAFPGPETIKWPVTAGWIISYEPDNLRPFRSAACTMERLPRRASTTRMRVIVPLYGRSTLEFTNSRFRRGGGARYTASLGHDRMPFFSNDGFFNRGEDRIDLSSPGGTYPIEELARASRIRIERNGRTLLSLPLDGFAQALPFFGRCIAHGAAAQQRAALRWKHIERGKVIVERVAP